MTGNFCTVSLPDLLQLTLAEIRQNRFMGIPGSLFYRPQSTDRFGLVRYGQYLETPVGVAAGPHTQLALNIVAGWLCGARYIELKTIQTLDELEVSKPCIDMQDEGYNCEWSQELKVHESFAEYLNAWILIHVLRRELGFAGPCGTMFNMSVGYNLEGIMNTNVQWFFNRMLDCSEELATAKNSIRSIYPAIDLIDIPARISDHVTLSTMHGCPPDEIEKIGLYLIREKKLHTTIKLNPTLLGAKDLRQLLNKTLGFTAEVPDMAFEHDLKYPDALKILESLGVASGENGLQFGVKLTNTLESVNNKDVFGSSEPMMYMSGRALHPISIRLARKLQNDLDGALDVSFSAGVDCFNIADVLSCGMKPVTVCSDLLKPGGYGRLHQYIENLRDEFALKQADSIDDYILNVAGSAGDVTHPALYNLNQYADRVAGNPAYHKHSLTEPSIKTSRELGWFDCIHAPCTDTCPTNQDIPEYMHHTSAGDIPAAFEAIFRTNPFPSVTGMVCDHLCQLKCTRLNYDEPLQIREIKRFVAEMTTLSAPEMVEMTPPQALPPGEEGRKAAIIGAGPAGLSCGWFLRKAGFEVDIFEQKNLAGGMVSAAIPSFRLTSQAIETDIDRILASGIHLQDNHCIDVDRFEALRDDYDAIFLAAGAQKSVKLKIDGVESDGVIDPLEFLFDVRLYRTTQLGSQVVIIGGGNTAMDAARTASRMVGKEGSVTIIYRRTIKEMPADQGEIKAVLEEGIKILELTNPTSVQAVDGRVTGLICTRNMLTLKGPDGRSSPVAIPGSDFEISCDTIIPAIGQQLDINFIDPEDLKTVRGEYKTRIPKLYIGGDALRGASTAINAIADGRKAALEILTDMEHFLPAPARGGVGGGVLPSLFARVAGEGASTLQSLLHRKATREYGFHPMETALDNRQNFEMVIASLTAEEARKEASRCLQCDEICNVCVSVCPNLANFGYQIEPVSYSLQKAVLKDDGTIAIEADKIFRVGQQFQILNIRDLCNECGNCTTFCPSSGRPFADKPGISLSAKSLNQEAAGFLISRLPEKIMLVYKDQDNIRTLSLAGGQYIYETNQVRAIINPDNFTLLSVKFLTPCVREFHFEFAAGMSIILKGAMQIAARD
ncbi:MAG: putative selenate reductase subunit YgfK [Bacteroidetes bacterium]|nr:putative selenate reductase subunit YgfK [Bacteroidota bacterium]